MRYVPTPWRASAGTATRGTYETVLALDPPPAEERWIRRKLAMLENGAERT